MGTGNRSLARVVDEIPDFHPSASPTIPEPLLVFLDLKNRISVCQMTLQFEVS